MAGEVFVGRPRPLWKIILYSLVTFGIYGRVFLLRTAREIDGHEVLFLDLRLYRLALLLPVVGPLIVKWRLARLVQHLVRHDAAAARVHPAALRWAALLPWIPLYHVLLQRHLAPHWRLHRKYDDLTALKQMIESRRKEARSAAARAEVDELERRAKEREQELEDTRQAALAVREALAARQRAEQEIRASGARRRGHLPRLLAWRRKSPRTASVPEPTGKSADAPSAPVSPRLRFPFVPRKARYPASKEPAFSSPAVSRPESPASTPSQRSLGRVRFWRKKGAAAPPPQDAAASSPEPALVPAAPARKARRKSQR